MSQYDNKNSFVLFPNRNLNPEAPAYSGTFTDQNGKGVGDRCLEEDQQGWKGVPLRQVAGEEAQARDGDEDIDF
jgi:hypothetical protein